MSSLGLNSGTRQKKRLLCTNHPAFVRHIRKRLEIKISKCIATLGVCTCVCGVGGG